MERCQSGTFPNTDNGKTADKLSEKINLSSRTIKRCSGFAEAVEKVREISPVAAQKILQGEIKDAVTALPQITKKTPEKLPEVVKKNRTRKQKGQRSS